MNLMIVEDEMRLRNALTHNLPWEEHGIDVIGTAGSGVEALQQLERKRPDIMLIDVQMPEMDGLTLVRKLKERKETGSFLKVIILSGHDNFAFAQDAMSLGVFRYLLKPAGEEEILNAVLEAVGQLRLELEQWQSQSALQVKWKEHLPHLRDTFFQHWISGKFEEWEVLRRSRDYYIPLDWDARLAVAVVDVDPVPEQDPRYSPQDMPLLHFTLQCIAKELLQEPGCWVCGDPQGCTVLIFVVPAGMDDKDAILSVHSETVRLLGSAKEVLKMTASAGICGAVGGIKEVSMLYEQACRALQDRIVFGRNIAIPYRAHNTSSRSKELRGQPHLEKALEIGLETADEDKALQALQGLWEAEPGRAETAEEMHEAMLYLNSLFVRIIQKQGWSVHQVLEGDVAYFHNVRLLGDKEQTWSLLVRTVRSIASYVRKQRSTSNNQLVKSILAIVDQEIDREMTLHTVADRLFVNSSYLSRLFKQETGVSFSAYVLERKMERAKAVLQEGGKVYDAARLVGYRDVSYFTKVFRKYWGVTPGEVKP